MRRKKDDPFIWKVTAALQLIFLLIFFHTMLLSNNDTTTWKNILLALVPSLSASAITWLFVLFYKDGKVCKFTSSKFEFRNKIPNLKEVESIIDFFIQDDNNRLDYILFNDSRDPEHEIIYHRVRTDFGKRLTDFKIKSTRNIQEELYSKIAEDIHTTVDELNDKGSLFTDLQQDVLFRVVYDVAKGGVFYYHLRDNVYIFGATVNQDDMDNNMADAQFRVMFNYLNNMIKD